MPTSKQFYGSMKKTSTPDSGQPAPAATEPTTSTPPTSPSKNSDPYEEMILQAAAALQGLPILEDSLTQREQDKFDKTN